MSKILIDPGHGGIDDGATGFGIKEKDRNLVMAKAIARELRLQGVQAVLTREDDKSILLADRIALEHKEKPDCFISCHMDAAAETASGMTIWVHSKADNVIWNWAQDVMKELKAVGFTTNRVQSVSRGYPGNPSADYYVNRETVSPSMLIEFGFITNQNNLNEHIEHCTEYAKAVAKAVCRFVGVEYKEIIPQLDGCVDRVEYDRVCALKDKFQSGLDEQQKRAEKAEAALKQAAALAVQTNSCLNQANSLMAQILRLTKEE